MKGLHENHSSKIYIFPNKLKFRYKKSKNKMEMKYGTLLGFLIEILCLKFFMNISGVTSKVKFISMLESYNKEYILFFFE